MSADLPAEGQSDTCPWLSLTPSKQSRLYNAQNLFTGKDRTDGPKDKFNSVLNLIVVIILPQTSHFSWEPPCPWVTRRKPRGTTCHHVGLGVSSCKAGLPRRQRAGTPQVRHCTEWIMLGPLLLIKTSYNFSTTPCLKGQTRCRGLGHGTGSLAHWGAVCHHKERPFTLTKTHPCPRDLKYKGI